MVSNDKDLYYNVVCNNYLNFKFLVLIGYFFLNVYVYISIVLEDYIFFNIFYSCEYMN